MSNNLKMIEVIARGLNDKLDEVVFVGGSIMEFYVNDPAMSKPRVTDDVDIVVEIAARAKYNEFETEIRELGFINDINGHAGRYMFDGVQMDLIATSLDAAGFTNIWYERGFEKNFKVKVGSFQIRIFPIEYYIASKFEAFKSRGAGSLLSSHDLEDIIYVFDGNEDIERMIQNSDLAVKNYLKNEIGKLLSNPNIREVVTGHLGYGAFYERAERIIEIFRRLSAML